MAFAATFFKMKRRKKARPAIFKSPNSEKVELSKSRPTTFASPAEKRRKKKNLHDWRDAVEIRSRKRRESLINRFLPVSKGRGGGHGGLICQGKGLKGILIFGHESHCAISQEVQFGIQI